jgi:three-Cys-motif partner protein
MSKLKFDRIGYWSEIKLDIIREYAQAYSTIFNAERQTRFSHVYIDAFAGAGIHLSKTGDEEILGSPLIALNTDPSFREYHFIDLDGSKVDHLRSLVGSRPDVCIYQGDCNVVMLDEVLPKVQYKDYRRGLCLLDPYGLHLNWQVIQTAGQMQTIDLFLNFPIMDMNMNVIWHRPEKADVSDVARMNAFWGDETWRNIAYEVEQTLFGPEEKKAPNETIAKAFRQRLVDVAGFARVPPPIPMRNTQGAIVYYLFFASQNQAGERIAQAIFNKYRDRGSV